MNFILNILWVLTVLAESSPADSFFPIRVTTVSSSLLLFLPLSSAFLLMAVAPLRFLNVNVQTLALLSSSAIFICLRIFLLCGSSFLLFLLYFDLSTKSRRRKRILPVHCCLIPLIGFLMTEYAQARRTQQPKIYLHLLVYRFTYKTESTEYHIYTKAFIIVIQICHLRCRY